MSAHRGHPRLACGRAGRTTSEDIPAAPPPEVSEQVAAALERAEELFSVGRELHFAKDPVTGRLAVRIQDPDGTVLRTLTPSEALDLITGATDDGRDPDRPTDHTGQP